MTRTAQHRRGRRVATGMAILCAVGSISSAALADGEINEPPEKPFEITDEILAESVSEYDPAAAVRQYDAAASVTALGSTGPTDDEVIVLESDILFAPNAWELPASAGDHLAVLAEEIPAGATVQVGGHTDSHPVDASRFDFDNQQLSELRAQAVADALSIHRPDLTLEVTGYGSEQPAVAENPQNPSTFAANRRVELRYGD